MFRRILLRKKKLLSAVDILKNRSTQFQRINEALSLIQEGKASSVSDALRVMAAKAIPVAKQHPIVYLSHSEELGPLSKRIYPFTGLSISLTSLATLPLPIAENSILFLLVPARDLSTGIGRLDALSWISVYSGPDNLRF